MSGPSQYDRLSFMPRFNADEDGAPIIQRHVHAARTSYNDNLKAECAAVRAPSGPVVHIEVMMADASREGRALVASGVPVPTIRPPSSCSRSQGLPQPPPSGKAAIGDAAVPPTARRSLRDAREAAVVAAKLHHEDAIGRFQARFPVIHVAAVTCAPRAQSPDHFGLRRHLEAYARRSSRPGRPPAHSVYLGARNHGIPPKTPQIHLDPLKLPTQWSPSLSPAIPPPPEELSAPPLPC